MQSVSTSGGKGQTGFIPVKGERGVVVNEVLNMSSTWGAQHE